MVVIRLNRVGAKKAPKYRVTVADSRRSSTGRFLEVVGHYNPNPSGNEKGLVMDMAKVEGWIKNGAQPTPRVKSLIRKVQSGEVKG